MAEVNRRFGDSGLANVVYYIREFLIIVTAAAVIWGVNELGKLDVLQLDIDHLKDTTHRVYEYQVKIESELREHTKKPCHAAACASLENIKEDIREIRSGP